MFYHLITQNDCTDISLANIFSTIRNALEIIQLIAPLLLLIMTVVHLTRLMTDPDDKKKMKKVKNSALAAVIIFFIPMFVNATMYLLDDSFTMSSCWLSATRNNQKPKYYQIFSDQKQATIISQPEQYETEETTNDLSIPKTQNKIINTTNYYPALEGNNFVFGSSNKTGGCSNDSVVHDVSSTEGTKIYAGMDGTLEYSQYVCGGRLYSYGNLAKITDESTKTYIMYGHLSKFIGVDAPVTATCSTNKGGPGCNASKTCGNVTKVIMGTKQVKKGDLIGYTGDVGNSAGPHLHIEIHENGSNSCVSDPFKAMGMR